MIWERMSAEVVSDGYRNPNVGGFCSLPGLYLLDLGLPTFPGVPGADSTPSRWETVL